MVIRTFALLMTLILDLFRLKMHEYEENQKVLQIKKVADWLSGSGGKMKFSHL